MHEAQLKAYLRRTFPTVQDIDDVVQESYLRIWKRQAAAPLASVKGFLFRIAQNLCFDVGRRQKRFCSLEVVEQGLEPVVQESPSVPDTVAAREETELLICAITTLPARCRQAYIYRKLHGLSQQEIAQRLGISENTVENHLSRAHRLCDEYLRARGVERG